MKRAALAAACLALSAGFLAPTAGAVPSPDPGGRHFNRIAEQMATTQCVAWKKHRKRVVRYVKRRGERVRVVRWKRWRTCAQRAVPAPAVPAPVPAEAVPAPALPPTPPPEPEGPTLPRLSVKAVEWAYTLSRPEVAAGAVVVELNNMGEDPHNLSLQLASGSGPVERIATIGPSKQGTARFDLAAGSYRLWCDLDEHEERGMSATLIVAG